jgi:hypothetical protein
VPIHKLSKGATKKIEAAIEELFDRAKVRMLGPNATGKRIIVSFVRDFSIPGLYEAAAREEGAIPNQETLDSLTRIASNYLDATMARTKARMINEINASLRDASLSGESVDVRTILGGKLSDVWRDVSTQVHAIIDSEASNAKNVSIMESILKVNAAEGIDDPIVYFVVVRDNVLCDECKRLHLMDDGKTPRLYKLSELGHGYHKKGEDDPKVGGLHPHCRCTLVTLMPGFGFSKEGFVKYVGRNHNEWSRQRDGG